jgi:hypothetical protein
MDQAAVVFLVLVALTFDYINGFHDAANSIANRRLDARAVARQGRAVGGGIQLLAAFIFGTAVAKTVGSGMIDVRELTFLVIFAGPLCGHRVGPDHLVLRVADQFVARAHRRLTPAAPWRRQALAPSSHRGGPRR